MDSVYDGRIPLSPSEFDSACRRLERIFPELSQTSGKRSVARNKKAGGDKKSKHLLGMARDYGTEGTPSKDMQQEYSIVAIALGLWPLYHNNHLHIQGLPPGEIPLWWANRYWEIPNDEET